MYMYIYVCVYRIVYVRGGKVKDNVPVEFGKYPWGYLKGETIPSAGSNKVNLVRNEG
jgi:hypothetical protein